MIKVNNFLLIFLCCLVEFMGVISHICLVEFKGCRKSIIKRTSHRYWKWYLNILMWLTKPIIKATRGLTKSNKRPKQSRMLATIEENLKVNHLHDCKNFLFVEHWYQGKLYQGKLFVHFPLFVIYSFNFLFFFLFFVWGQSEVLVHLDWTSGQPFAMMG